MQPFARPVARAVWGQAQLSFDRTARPAKTFRRAAAASLDSCLLSPFPAIGPRFRFYSSQLPPRDGDNKTTQPEKPQLRHGEPAPGSGSTTDSRADAAPNETTSSSSAELPSTLEGYRSNMNRKFSQMMDTLQIRTMNASQTLNDITGYSSIDNIKRQNAHLETALAEAHDRVRSARQAYKQSNTKRAATQREVTTLLARKDTWSPTDLERFTELYRTDHVLEGEVVSSQEALTEAEADEQSLSQRLNAGILKRYHEEQIWSDRIRRASTWGTWGLMGMNFLLFVVLQFVAEPWKRRRLVRGVVAEEKAVLEEVRSQLSEIKLAMEQREALPEPVVQAEFIEEQPAISSVDATAEAPMETPVDVPTESLRNEPIDTPRASDATWTEILSDPARLRDIAEDLYSERRVHLRMRDASLLALEGALAGAALAGSIALLLVRCS